MKLRTIILALLATISLGMAHAAGNNLVEQANQAFNAKQYKKAITLYEQAQRDGVSSQLYYNMGNTYYRLNDVANAVLYYERALKLDPSNGDARYNLEFVREKSQLNADHGSTFFTTLLGNTISRITSNGWAIIAIITLLLMFAAMAIYRVSSSILLQKIGFFGAITLLVITLLAIVNSIYVYNRSTDTSGAIVMTDKAPVLKSPHQENGKTEFSLQRGVRVEIVDSVKAGKSQKAMYKIETDDDRTGWIGKKDLEKI